MREVNVREACLCKARVCLACQCPAFCRHAAFVCVCVCGLRYVGQTCVRSPDTSRVGVRVGVGVVRGVCVRGMCDAAYVCARLTYVWACSICRDVPAGSGRFLVLTSVGMASVCFACECAECVGARHG